MKHCLSLLMIFCTLSQHILTAQSLEPKVSVDTYTGKGKVVVPLATVQDMGLIMPINLVNDVTGFKLSDNGRSFDSGTGNENLYGSSEYTYTTGVTTWRKDLNATANSIKIATGWNLIAGGVITRVVKGLPDDYYGMETDSRRGWLHGTGSQTVNSFLSSSDNNLGNCDDELSDYNILNSFGATIDTEPDIFNFDFGEFRGQFVFDYHTPSETTLRSVHTMPYQDLKITYTTHNNRISSFEITTNKGIVYKFTPTATIKKTVVSASDLSSSPELTDYFNTTIERYLHTAEYVEEWGLSKVTSMQDRGIEINILYENNDFTQTYYLPMNVTVKKNSSSNLYTRNLYIERIEKTYKAPNSIQCKDKKIFLFSDRIEIFNPDYH